MRAMISSPLAVVISTKNSPCSMRTQAGEGSGRPVSRSMKPTVARSTDGRCGASRPRMFAASGARVGVARRGATSLEYHAHAPREVVRRTHGPRGAILESLRRQDLNLRPSDYEPDELPAAPPRDLVVPRLE